jgi:hypothetical protein
MLHAKRVARLLHSLLVAALLLSSVTPALYAQDNIYLPLVTSGQEAAPATHLLFRTHVTVHTPAQWRDLARLDVLILGKGEDWALLLVTDRQLADLARLRYNPEQTDALATLGAANATLGTAQAMQRLLDLESQSIQAQRGRDAAQDTQAEEALYATLQAALRLLTTDEVVLVAKAASVDTDSDGLTDDQEGFWCTDPAKPDSDFDGAKDGIEVMALMAWMNNLRAVPPPTGKPF